MAKWFENKFDENDVRHYTKKSLKTNKLKNISRNFSVTLWLIIVNVIIFFLAWITIYIIGDEKFSQLFELQANFFFLHGTYWTLFTSMFLHLAFWHLLANMISLYVLGKSLYFDPTELKLKGLEDIIGRKRFFWLYIFSGIFASFFFVLLSFFLGNQCLINFPYLGCLGEKLFFNPKIFAVGASGAIFGLIGILAVLIPNKKIFLIAGPIVFGIISSVVDYKYPNSIYSSIFYILFLVSFFISIYVMLSRNRKLLKFALPIETTFSMFPFYAIIPLVLIGLIVPLPFGNTAHLGGLIAGLAYGFYIKNKYKKKSQFISKVFSK